MSLKKDEFPLKAKFKNRFPDPGECFVISIDWEEKRVCLSNGRYRYYPRFHEIVFLGTIPKTFI